MAQPTDLHSLVIHLVQYPKLLARLPPTTASPEGKRLEYCFQHVANNCIVLLKDGELTGPIAIGERIGWFPTHFTRNFGYGTKIVYYYYTGDLPWLEERDKSAAEWDDIINYTR